MGGTLGESEASGDGAAFAAASSRGKTAGSGAASTAASSRGETAGSGGAASTAAISRGKTTAGGADAGALASGELEGSTVSVAVNEFEPGCRCKGGGAYAGKRSGTSS
jgi:hypothetical protein